MIRMSNDLISWKAVIEENVDKVRVSSAEIVVHGTKENPYYEIEYFDLSDNEIHIGFSSYKLDVVFEYLEKYFDIVNEENKSDQVQDYHSDDLISRKAVIKAVDRHTREDETLDDDISVILEEVKTVFDKEKVIEKLKDQYNYSHKVRSKNDNIYFEYWDGRTDSYKDAIDIVEKGGIE